MYTLASSKKFAVNWLEMPGSAIIKTSNGTGSVGQILTVGAGGTLEWTSNGSGSMSSWLLTGDNSTSSAVQDGDTVTVAGGDKITTAAALHDIKNKIEHNYERAIDLYAEYGELSNFILDLEIYGPKITENTELMDNHVELLCSIPSH